MVGIAVGHASQSSITEVNPRNKMAPLDCPAGSTGVSDNEWFLYATLLAVLTRDFSWHPDATAIFYRYIFSIHSG